MEAQRQAELAHQEMLRQQELARQRVLFVASWHCCLLLICHFSPALAFLPSLSLAVLVYASTYLC
jgi:hypothetical protein